MVDGLTFSLGLWDNIGSQDVQPSSYAQTDIFILCYSVVDPGTFGINIICFILIYG